MAQGSDSVTNKLCDLCRLPIEADGFHLETTSGSKQFCCEGCQGVYQMLHGDEIKTDSGPAKPAS